MKYVLAVCLGMLVLVGTSILADSNKKPKPAPEPPADDSRPGPFADGLLAGRVVDTCNRNPPATYIEVIAVREQAEAGIPIDVKADKCGYFTIPGLKPGQQYRLIARSKNGDMSLTGMAYATAPNLKILIQVSQAVAPSNTPPVLPPTIPPGLDGKGRTKPAAGLDDAQLPRLSNPPTPCPSPSSPPPPSPTNPGQSSKPAKPGPHTAPCLPGDPSFLGLLDPILGQWDWTPRAVSPCDPDLKEIVAKNKKLGPTLLATLKDKDADLEIRKLALLSLAELDDETRSKKELQSALVATLKDSDGQMRMLAAAMLIQCSPTTFPVLCEALKHENGEVRANAAWVLAYAGIEANKAVPVLLAAMKDRDKQVRHRAAFALHVVLREVEQKEVNSGKAIGLAKVVEPASFSVTDPGMILPTTVTPAAKSTCVSSSTLQSGDTPGCFPVPANRRTYRVKALRGETMIDIARRMLDDTRHLGEIQQMNPDWNPFQLIPAGTVLQLPDTRGSRLAAPCCPAPMPAPSSSPGPDPITAPCCPAPMPAPAPVPDPAPSLDRVGENKGMSDDQSGQG